MRLTRIFSRARTALSPCLANFAVATVVGFILYPAATYAQPGTPVWTNFALALAVDKNGDVFAAGGSGSGYVDSVLIKYSGAGLPLWTNSYPEFNGGWIGVAVDGHSGVCVISLFSLVKYSSTGVPLWTNRYDDPAFNYHNHAIAEDGSNNVFVTGDGAYPDSGYDFVTIKYDENGVGVWTNHYNGPDNGGENPLAVAVGGNGNVYVTGYSVGAGSGYDYATVAYSNTGVPLWTNCYDGQGDEDRVQGMAVDGTGKVFVTGYSYGGLSTGYDYVTIAYSTAGVPLWTNYYNGPTPQSSDYAYGVAVDSNGNVFVTGASGRSSDFTDYATIAYSNAGVPLWTNRYSGLGYNPDRARAIVVDKNGNVYVSGNSAIPGSGYDNATIAYSNAGLPLWTNRYAGPGISSDLIRAIAVDKDCGVFVTGFSDYGSGNSTFFTIKYSGFLSPIPLDYQIINNQIVLNWTNAAFILQSAPAVQGIYTNIPSATSPYTNLISGDQQYFRLKGN